MPNDNILTRTITLPEPPYQTLILLLLLLRGKPRRISGRQNDILECRQYPNNTTRLHVEKVSAATEQLKRVVWAKPTTDLQLNRFYLLPMTGQELLHPGMNIRVLRE